MLGAFKMLPNYNNKDYYSWYCTLHSTFKHKTHHQKTFPKSYNSMQICIILLNSNHITLNINTPTRLPPNQTQQLTSPDITSASTDLHHCTYWQTIHSLTYDYLLLFTTLSIQHKTKTTHFHFTKTITNYQKANWTLFKQHVEDLISHRPHSTNVHEANKCFTKAIMDANKLFIPKGNHNSTNHTHPCIFASLSIIITIFANKTDQTHKSLLLKIT